MKRLFVFLASLSVVVASLVAVTAQDVIFRQEGGPAPGGMRMQVPNFADLDKNKDKKLSRDEFQGPAQFFDRLDENRDGFIDEQEWGRMRGRFGGGGGPRFGEQLSKFLDFDVDGKVTREEFARITELFDALDRDHNAELNQEEFNRFFEAIRELEQKATGGVDVNLLFDKHDKNKDGKITADEMGEERSLRPLDLDRDQTVTKEEATRALRQIAERARQKAAQQPKNP